MKNIISFLVFGIAVIFSITITDAANITYTVTQKTKAENVMAKLDELIIKKNLNKIKSYELVKSKLQKISENNRIAGYLSTILDEKLNELKGEMSSCKKVKYLGESQWSSSPVYSEIVPNVTITANKEGLSQTGTLIEINEGENVFLKANVTNMDTKEYRLEDGTMHKGKITYLWQDFSLGENLCDDGSEIQTVRWKAPLVDNDMDARIMVSIFDDLGHQVSASFPIKVINADKSTGKAFSITEIKKEEKEKYFSKTGYRIKLDSPEEIKRIEYSMKIPEGKELCCGYSHDWGDYNDPIGTDLEKISDTEYIYYFDTTYYNMYPSMDFRFRIYNEKNVSSEKEALGIFIKQGKYRIYSSLLPSDIQQSRGWLCIRELPSKTRIGCKYKYENESSISIDIDRKYENSKLDAYMVVIKEGLKGVNYDYSKYELRTTLSIAELKSKGVFYGPHDIKNSISGGDFRID